MRADRTDIAPLVVGEYTLSDGRSAVPAFELFAERFLADDYAPDTVADTCGVSADTIRRLARELAAVAFDQAITLEQPWTDAWGREHARMTGRPVAMHAMRGISAHANGFHTCRTLHLLQMVLGAIDTPGSFRYQPPYPKSAPPANRPGRRRRDDGSLDAAPLGYVHSPDDLLVDADGNPRRIDKAFSWEHPFAAHGMLQNVIANACKGDPQRIDTLFLFMANMGWNSAMNTTATRQMLCERDPASGEYRIPHIIYADAYDSETVAFADLVLPDTTYLERHDCISLLDRPISDADSASDAIRQPVVAPDRDVRPFQDVLLDLGARLRLPGLIDADGAAKYPRGYAQYMVEHERAPGIGLLAGWRGADGSAAAIGAPNPDQLQRYIEHDCHWQREIPAAGRYYKMANRDYLEWAKSLGFVASTRPIELQFYAESLQRFRLAAQGHGAVQPPAAGSRARAALLRPVAVLVSRAFTRVRSRKAGQNRTSVCGLFTKRLSTPRDQPATDVHVPRLGFAERMAAPDRNAQLSVPASGHRGRERRRGRRLDLARCAARTHPGAGATACGHCARNAVDMERDRQEAWRVEARSRCTGERRRLPAQSPDRRIAAGLGRRRALRECRPGDRSGRMVRPARAHRARRDPARRRTSCRDRGRGSRMSAQAWMTLAIVIGAIALFASEKMRIDLVALIVLVLLVVLQLVSPAEALAGFSNEATVTVAAMFALSLGIERSGALEPLGRLLSRIRQPWLLTLALMLAIAPMGAFVKNIALVATFLPLALRVCARPSTSPARVLMPMAYAAQMGGVCTLIGTSSNLLADSIAQHHGLPPFGVFEFTRMGALLAVAGIVYLMLIGRWLLPQHVEARAARGSRDRQVRDRTAGHGGFAPDRPSPSPTRAWAKAMASIRWSCCAATSACGRRGRRNCSPRATCCWCAANGTRSRISASAPSSSMRPSSATSRTATIPRVLAEMMVAPASQIEGRTLGELDFKWRYDATSLAIHRRGHILREKLKDARLEVGDVLLMLVEEDVMPKLRSDDRLHRAQRTRGRPPPFAQGDASRSRSWSESSSYPACTWLPIPVAATRGCDHDGDRRLLRQEGPLRKHGLEDHHPARARSCRWVRRSRTAVCRRPWCTQAWDWSATTVRWPRC